VKPYYQDSAVTLYHGDCREVMLGLSAEQSPALVVTDPPYGMGRFATDGHDFLTVVGPALQAAFRMLLDGGSMFAFSSTAQVVNLANAVGEPIKRLLWMYKPNDCTYPLHGWLLKSEAILWFGKGKKLRLEARRPFRHDCYVVTSVGQEGVDGHPTVKPLRVVSDLVSRCPTGGLVLDPFVGSGTTLEACRNHHRRAIGIEIEERYCEIAANRLRQEVLL